MKGWTLMLASHKKASKVLDAKASALRPWIMPYQEGWLDNTLRSDTVMYLYLNYVKLGANAPIRPYKGP